MAVVLALGAFTSIVLGGALALRVRDRLHLVLGFTAGAILGVVAFGLIPEIVELAESTGRALSTPMIALVAGFLGFHIIEKGLLVHVAHEDEYADHHHHPAVGFASAGALIGHSFIDGMAIGLALQIDEPVGIAVAVAVIAHGFADGLNTVSLMLAHGNSRRRAATMLGLDAVAPIVGALSTLFFTVPDTGLLIYLGVFAGFLLYIGASDILPEAHADHPSVGSIAMTILGTGLLYGIVQVLE